jgi:hypothetical protein
MSLSLLEHDDIEELSHCLTLAIAELKTFSYSLFITRSAGRLVQSRIEPLGPSLGLHPSGRKLGTVCVSVFGKSNLVTAHLHDVPLENVFSVAIACLAAPELFPLRAGECYQFSTAKFLAFQKSHLQ